eukprot:11195338-Alexandrium_andersonii.AAC.1
MCRRATRLLALALTLPAGGFPGRTPGSGTMRLSSASSRSKRWTTAAACGWRTCRWGRSSAS